MAYPRNERIFFVHAAELDDIIVSISRYGQWKLFHLHDLGFFIELTDNADMKLRTFLKTKLSKK